MRFHFRMPRGEHLPQPQSGFARTPGEAHGGAVGTWVERCRGSIVASIDARMFMYGLQQSTSDAKTGIVASVWPVVLRRGPQACVAYTAAKIPVFQCGIG